MKTLPAWAAWWSLLADLEARHGWREVKTDLPHVGLTKSRIRAASETESETGFRRWFKRGLEKLKTGKKIAADGQDKHLRLPVNAAVILLRRPAMPSHHQGSHCLSGGQLRRTARV